jgi:hypothetical protein
MSDSDVKQVTVALTHPDELNPRRRRRTRKFKDDMESQDGGAAPVDAYDVHPGLNQSTVTIQKEPSVQTTTVSATPGAVPVPSTAPVQSVTPVQPTPVLAAVPMVGGGGAPVTQPGAVHIREKKNKVLGAAPGSKAGGELNAPNAPKIILHKKRITNAPVAQTLKKPKFVVSAPSATSVSAPAPIKKMPPLPAPQNETISGGAGEDGMNLKPLNGGGVHQEGLKRRRRFTERRIKIEVKPTVKTRKSRKVLKERIDAMPIQAVRRLLIKKGILKPKATVPPESMMRSMLQDYYLLKQSE